MVLDYHSQKVGLKCFLFQGNTNLKLQLCLRQNMKIIFLIYFILQNLKLYEEFQVFRFMLRIRYPIFRFQQCHPHLNRFWKSLWWFRLIFQHLDFYDRLLNFEIELQLELEQLRLVYLYIQLLFKPQLEVAPKQNSHCLTFLFFSLVFFRKLQK